MLCMLCHVSHPASQMLSPRWMQLALCYARHRPASVHPRSFCHAPVPPKLEAPCARTLAQQAQQVDLPRFLAMLHPEPAATQVNSVSSAIEQHRSLTATTIAGHVSGVLRQPPRPCYGPTQHPQQSATSRQRRNRVPHNGLRRVPQHEALGVRCRASPRRVPRCHRRSLCGGRSGCRSTKACPPG